MALKIHKAARKINNIIKFAQINKYGRMQMHNQRTRRIILVILMSRLKATAAVTHYYFVRVYFALMKIIFYLPTKLFFSNKKQSVVQDTAEKKNVLF